MVCQNKADKSFLTQKLFQSSKSVSNEKVRKCPALVNYNFGEYLSLHSCYEAMNTSFGNS